MELVNSFRDIWFLISALIFFVAWCIRLEAKVLYLEKREYEKKQEDKELIVKLESKMDKQELTLVEILQSLAKINGVLEYKKQSSYKNQTK